MDQDGDQPSVRGGGGGHDTNKTSSLHANNNGHDQTAASAARSAPSGRRLLHRTTSQPAGAASKQQTIEIKPTADRTVSLRSDVSSSLSRASSSRSTMGHLSCQQRGRNGTAAATPQTGNSSSSGVYRKHREEQHLGFILICLCTFFIFCQSIKILPDIYEVTECDAGEECLMHGLSNR